MKTILVSIIASVIYFTLVEDHQTLAYFVAYSAGAIVMTIE